MLRTGTITTSVVPSGLVREGARFLEPPRRESPDLDFLPGRRTTFFPRAEALFLVVPFLVFFWFRFNDLANLVPLQYLFAQLSVLVQAETACSPERSSMRQEWSTLNGP
ncbi:MAG TPA: hypothetical protein QF446_01855 [Planctomycetota bacterium]|nr:hypothetical protein [Planctomycetota bacterium]